MRRLKHGKMSGGCGDSCCLKLEGLNVRIQGEEILEDVSFHLHCGEITALIGPNGAGKSTLFRSILGQLPYSGSITFAPAGGPAIRLADGTVMGGTRPLIGYVPQSPSFDRGDPVSVLDFFTAATARWPVCLPIPGKYRERCRRSLERVHGGDLLDKPMGGLSGGQLQRVCIARAIATKPRFIVFDEAVSSLDVSVQAQVLELLLELKGDMTYLFIAHDVQAVTYLCDHIMFLHEGTIAESLEKEHLARASSGYAQRLLQSVIPFNPDACVATV